MTLVRANILGLILGMGLSGAPAQTPLYQLTFDPGAPANYDVVFGAPTPVASFQGLTGALRFRGVSSYDQIRLPIHAVASAYQLDFDVVTQGLVNSKYAFTVLLDTPQVRTLSLHGGLAAFSPYQPSPYFVGASAPFADGQPYHVRIRADFAANFWDIAVNGNVLYQNLLNATELHSIRFSLAPWYNQSPTDPNVFAAIDNVVVLVPEPSGAVLLGLALGALAVRRLA